MSSSKLLNYPFTFTSTVAVYLKPFSDIVEPDTVIIELLGVGYSLGFLLEHNIEQPDKLTSKAIKKLEKINLHLTQSFDDNKIKILQTPKNFSREEPYICEIIYDGGFVLGSGVDSELAKKMIEIGVVSIKQDKDSVLSEFIDATGNNYIEYEDTIIMAYHSMEILSAGIFKIREPINYEE